MPRIISGEILEVQGTLDLTSATAVNVRSGVFARSALVESVLAEHPVRFDTLRVWDDLSANLPGTAATDDLGIIEGTYGTDSPTIQTSDAKATTVTQYARVQVPLPFTYKAGQDIRVRVRAGMVTTVSDGTATVDVECYKQDGDGGVGSDICTTSATTINSLIKSNKDFTITASGVAPGDVLDIRIAIAITDTATATAVIGEISKLSVLLDSN